MASAAHDFKPLIVEYRLRGARFPGYSHSGGGVIIAVLVLHDPDTFAAPVSACQHLRTSRRAGN